MCQESFEGLFSCSNIPIYLLKVNNGSTGIGVKYVQVNNQDTRTALLAESINSLFNWTEVWSKNVPDILPKKVICSL